jgi:O-acetylserine/cysteine efflux transporter
MSLLLLIGKYCITPGKDGRMNANRRRAVAALIAAGLLWGSTVPLSKVALEWLSPGWLTAVRFGMAAAVLLPAARRRGLRRAFTPRILVAGAVGYGGSVLVQNAGIGRTSVTHAALLIGAAPVLVAIIAAVWQRSVARPAAWLGFALSLGGVGLVTVGGGGGGATAGGDGLVLVSLVLSATMTVAQGALLAGRDPVAVTAVEFLGAALGALPVAVLTGGAPAGPSSAGPVLAVIALIAGGTLLPFTLFAFGQSRVSAEFAGAFLNLEPLVGVIAGAVAFGDPVGFAQIGGGTAIVAGIGLSCLPMPARAGRGLAGRGPVEQVTVEQDRLVLCDLAGRPERADLAVQFGSGGPASNTRIESALHQPGRVLTVAVKAVSGRDVPDEIVYRPEPVVGAARLAIEQRVGAVGRGRGDLQSP